MYKMIFLSMIAVLFVSFDATAGVTFLPAAPGAVGSGRVAPSQPSNATKCRTAGYTVTSCARGLVLSEQCPYDKRYYKKCKADTTAYKKLSN